MNTLNCCCLLKSQKVGPFLTDFWLNQSWRITNSWCFQKKIFKNQRLPSIPVEQQHPPGNLVLWLCAGCCLTVCWVWWTGLTLLKRKLPINGYYGWCVWKIAIHKRCFESWYSQLIRIMRINPTTEQRVNHDTRIPCLPSWMVDVYGKLAGKHPVPPIPGSGMGCATSY